MDRRYGLKATVVYDNCRRQRKGLMAAWGLSIHLRFKNKNILFDTGWDPHILKNNLQHLGLTLSNIDFVFISHSHWDHIGGLPWVLRQITDNATVVIPTTLSTHMKDHIKSIANVVEVGKNPVKIDKNVYSTGVIGYSTPEQSLFLCYDNHAFLIVGCSHPGVNTIVDHVRNLGYKIYGIMGGFHGFNNIDFLSTIKYVVPLHCTQSKDNIIKSVEGGINACTGDIVEF